MSSASSAPGPADGTQRGVLYVVATPIGNLGDLSPRAAEVLAEVDVVAAEDTRRTGRLLAHLGLRRPQVSCHKFGEARHLDALLAPLAAGRRVALVTDGGTPAISDPGHRLVAAAHAAGHRVVAVPGPCAAVAALSVAGLTADRFLFAGFLPARTAARRDALASLAPFEGTLVFHEAPHRAIEFLDDALAVLGDRDAVLCRELTKLHEEVRRATVSALRDDLAARESVLGEIVFVVAGARAGTAAARGPCEGGAAPGALAAPWKEALEADGGDERRALRRLSRELGLPRADLRRRLQADRLL